MKFYVLALILLLILCFAPLFLCSSFFIFIYSGSLAIGIGSVGGPARIIAVNQFSF
jgi:asparagine N-glycosylation enzyme membrane subunit Stt3